MSVPVISSRRPRGIGVLVLAVASTLLALLVAAPAFAGEVSDEEERLTKIVISVNTDPERDPASAVEGEVITVYEGDYVTFRIGLNDDQDRPQFDRTGQIRDSWDVDHFEIAQLRTEFGHACEDETETGPGALECQVTLGEDGNAAVWLTLRALAIGDAQTDENGCLATTNSVQSVHPSGSERADVMICPAAQRPDDRSTPPPTWPPPGAASPSASAVTTAAPSGTAAASDQGGGGAMPDTSTGGSGASPALLVAAGGLMLVSIGALVVPRRRAAHR